MDISIYGKKDRNSCEPRIPGNSSKNTNVRRQHAARNSANPAAAYAAGAPTRRAPSRGGLPAGPAGGRFTFEENTVYEKKTSWEHGKHPIILRARLRLLKGVFLFGIFLQLSYNNPEYLILEPESNLRVCDIGNMTSTETP